MSPLDPRDSSPDGPAETAPRELYGSNGSPFSASCRLVIYAKGLEEQFRQQPPVGGLGSPGYRLINPLGKIPTLATESGPLPESSVICEYLEDRYPAPSLMPPDPAGRARARLLVRIADLYLYPRLSVLARRHDADPGDPEVEDSIDALSTHLGHLEHWLSADGYAVGEPLTLADCSLVPCLFYVRALLARRHRSQVFEEHPKTAGYFGRVAQNAHAARVLGELQAALRQRMANTSRALSGAAGEEDGPGEG